MVILHVIEFLKYIFYEQLYLVSKNTLPCESVVSFI